MTHLRAVAAVLGAVLMTLVVIAHDLARRWIWRSDDLDRW